ncbi:response regulator [Thalassiella azotivora]
MTGVLLVDDDPLLVRALTVTLRARGYEVTATDRGGAVRGLLAEHLPDVVVLDLGLPDVDGLEVLRAVRTGSSVPVIVLSARHGQRDKVDALDAGADDYVTKPFGVDELLARVRAAVRRGQPADAAQEPVRAAAFTVDLAAGTVRAADGEVRLTPTEWHLLEALVRQEGRLVSQQDLLRQVWGPGYGTEANYLRVYVAQLRRKLEPDPAHPRHLLTVPGRGYRFVR